MTSYMYLGDNSGIISGIIGDKGGNPSENGCFNTSEANLTIKVCSTPNPSSGYIRSTKTIEFKSQNGKNVVWLNGNDITINSTNIKSKIDIVTHYSKR